MNIKDLERVEYKLEQITRERDRLREEKQDQQQVVAALNLKIQALEMTISKHPMPLSQALQDPASLEGKLAQLEETILRLTAALANAK